MISYLKAHIGSITRAIRTLPKRRHTSLTNDKIKKNSLDGRSDRLKLRSKSSHQYEFGSGPSMLALVVH